MLTDAISSALSTGFFCPRQQAYSICAHQLIGFPFETNRTRRTALQFSLANFHLAFLSHISSTIQRACQPILSIGKLLSSFGRPSSLHVAALEHCESAQEKACATRETVSGTRQRLSVLFQRLSVPSLKLGSQMNTTGRVVEFIWSRN